MPQHRSDEYVARVVAARILDPDLVAVDAHFVGAVDVNADRRIRMVITVLEGRANVPKVLKRRTLSFSCTPEIATALANSLLAAVHKDPDDDGWRDVGLDEDHRFDRQREDRWDQEEP